MNLYYKLDLILALIWKRKTMYLFRKNFKKLEEKRPVLGIRSESAWNEDVRNKCNIQINKDKNIITFKSGLVEPHSILAFGKKRSASATAIYIYTNDPNAIAINMQREKHSKNRIGLTIVTRAWGIVALSVTREQWQRRDVRNASKQYTSYNNL